MEFSKLLDLVLGNSNLNQSKQLKDLNEELIYLSQFINNKISLIDWVSSSGIKQDLIKAQLQITETLSKNGYNFSKSSISDIIQISCKTSVVKNYFDEYLELNKQLKEHTLLKDNLNSKYYKDETVKVFYGEVDEEYTDIETINEIEVNIVDKEVVSYKTVKEIVPTIKTITRIEKKLVPHTFEEIRDIIEYKQVEERIIEDAPIRSWFTGIVTLGISTIGGKLKDEKVIIKSVPVTRSETFTNKKEIETDVAVTEEVTVDEEVEKIVKDIEIVKEEQPRIITKQVPVKKSRKVAKYKDEIKKVFDESSYNSDLSQIQNNINNSRNAIQSKLRSSHSSGIVTDFNKEEPLPTNDLEKEYLDLISLWRNTEYSIFNSNYPNKYSKVKKTC
ncbi:hypothetical protein ACTFIW_009680 [Dictyostelium discoideum]